MKLAELATPSLIVDDSILQSNIDAMAAVRPGPQLRPHVKAFKSTDLAKRLVAAGHTNFTCATIREVEGMAAAGLGHDLLLANEVLDAARLGAVAESGARVTLAVDSDATVDAAAAGGVREVVIDVNVGLPRCGCDPADAGRLADRARAAGLEVRGVMGYEGHLMMVLDPDDQLAQVGAAMALLLAAHADVGGDLVSAGGTGTYDCNTWATEIQAGSYTLMDTQYGRRISPFRQALAVWSQVLSVSATGGYVVSNAGLKSLGMDHGDPQWDRGDVLFCSDEHVTLFPAPDTTIGVGDYAVLIPAHVDPTVARHEALWVTSGWDPDDEVIDRWPIDLRHW
ncbi:MAG: metal-activated pyridoxal enzyme [Acidimicrobiales bacterium]|nr:metal-activated pyridoxal enzyme [Acidimicrobiales bacterium]